MATPGTKLGLFFCLLTSAAGVGLACSSSSTPVSNPDGGGEQDSGAAKDSGSSKDTGTVKNCIPPGTPNNSKGIGGYCDMSGKQCPMSEPDGGIIFCTAAFSSITPPGEWFCTALCDPTLDASATEQCGENMVCRQTSMASACVPKPCNIDAGF